MDDDLQEELRSIKDDKAGKVSINLLLDALPGAEIDDYTTDPSERKQALLALVEQVQQLQAEVDELKARVPENSTKQAKVQSIAQYADNQRSRGDELVSLTPDEIQGATGVSERYAYKLCEEEDGLPSEKEWIVTRKNAPRFGSVEFDHDKMEKGIVLDFGGVQSDGVPLNLFNNGERRKSPAEVTQEGKV